MTTFGMISRPAAPFAVAGLVAVLLATMAPLHAQTAGELTTNGDSVAEYDVAIKTAEGADVVDEVVAAVEDADATAEKIKLMFNADSFELVRLRDQDVKQIEPVISARESVLTDLRTAIETSALFYNALQAQAVEVRSVIAVNVREGDVASASGHKVTVFFTD